MTESEPPSGRTDIRVVTWNVSYEPWFAREMPRTLRPWEERGGEVAAYVRAHDIVALQELSGRQFGDLRASLLQHDTVAVETPLPQPVIDAIRERSGIVERALIDVALFFSEAFSILEHGNCWLSPTPEVPLSIGYGARAPRQLVWAVALHRPSRRRILVATTHIDWRSVGPMLRIVRERLERLVVEAGAGLLLGDLNTHTAPGELAGLLQDGWRDAHPTGRLDEDETYLGDLGGGPGRIDHVLVRGEIRADGWWRGTDVSERKLSDHLPVGATLHL